MEGAEEADSPIIYQDILHFEISLNNQRQISSEGEAMGNTPALPILSRQIR